jgi:hypothetical protein
VLDALARVKGRKIRSSKMVETEREILREKDEETNLGERKPFESSRQAEYEDSALPKRRDERAWDYEDME